MNWWDEQDIRKARLRELGILPEDASELERLDVTHRQADLDFLLSFWGDELPPARERPNPYRLVEEACAYGREISREDWLGDPALPPPVHRRSETRGGAQDDEDEDEA